MKPSSRSCVEVAAHRGRIQHRLVHRGHEDHGRAGADRERRDDARAVASRDPREGRRGRGIDDDHVRPPRELEVRDHRAHVGRPQAPDQRFVRQRLQGESAHEAQRARRRGGPHAQPAPDQHLGQRGRMRGDHAAGEREHDARLAQPGGLYRRARGRAGSTSAPASIRAESTSLVSFRRVPVTPARSCSGSRGRRSSPGARARSRQELPRGASAARALRGCSARRPARRCARTARAEAPAGGPRRRGSTAPGSERRAERAARAADAAEVVPAVDGAAVRPGVGLSPVGAGRAAACSTVSADQTIGTARRSFRLDFFLRACMAWEPTLAPPFVSIVRVSVWIVLVMLAFRPRLARRRRRSSTSSTSTAHHARRRARVDPGHHAPRGHRPSDLPLVRDQLVRRRGEERAPLEGPHHGAAAGRRDRLRDRTGVHLRRGLPRGLARRELARRQSPTRCSSQRRR